MPYIFLDVETTGLLVDQHEVWEIAYAVDRGPIHKSFVTHSTDGADPKALELTHYVERMTGVPEFSGLFEANLKEAAAGGTLVAANPSFDDRFLVKRWGFRPWHYRLLDVEAYAMPYFDWQVPEGLATIAKALDIEWPNHEAAQDVTVLRQAFYKLANAYSLGGLG